MIQFGGRFLPVHFVGGLIEGTVPAGGLNVSYKGGVGNGRNSVISRAGDAGDVNGNRAWLVNAFAKPDKLYGLEFGGSVYGDRITLANGREFDEQIVGGHVVWNKEDPEIIAEIAGGAPRGGQRGVDLESRVLRSRCVSPQGRGAPMEAVLPLRAHRYRRRRRCLCDRAAPRRRDRGRALRLLAVCRRQGRVPHLDPR
jgi:hypothetical protein